MQQAPEDRIDAQDGFDGDEQDDHDLKPRRAIGVENFGDRARGFDHDLELVLKRRGALLEFVFILEAGVEALKPRPESRGGSARI